MFAPEAPRQTHRRRMVVYSVLGCLGAVLLPSTSTVSAQTPTAPVPVTVVGTVRTLAADTVEHVADPAGKRRFRGRSDDVYRQRLVFDDGRGYFLERKKGQKAVHNNTRVRVSGTLAGNALQADSVQELGSAPAAVMSPSGTTRVLVMLAYWTAPDGVTQASATQQMFTDTNGWYRDASYSALGQTGDVTPWLSIAGPANNACYGDGDSVMAQAKSAAAGRGYDVSAYSNYVVYFPNVTAPGNDCSAYAGWAYIGSTGAWLNGYMDRRVTVHEQGHNYGLYHSHSQLCSNVMSGTCTYNDVGDDYDAMGSADYTGHFNAAQKTALGWMTNRTRDLTAGGSVTLSPFETDATSITAAVVTVSSSRSYWLEYRQPLDYDDQLPAAATDGVLVHVLDSSISGDPAGSLLDVCQSDGVSLDTATLRAGPGWVTPEGVRLQLGTITAAGASVTVSRPSMGSISGVVRDGKGNPLRGAVVTVEGCGQPNVTTGSTGAYSLPQVPSGTYTLHVAGICKSPQSRSVAVSGATTADFTLPTPAFASCDVVPQSWVSGTNVLALSGDDASVAVTLPFTYRHVGADYTTAYVSTNGHVNFLAPSIAYLNTGIPSVSEPNAAIYGFWDDLEVDAASSVRTATLGSAPTRRYVIEWRNVALHGDLNRRFSFEVVLSEDRKSRLLMQYRDIDVDTAETGTGATLGTENAAGDGGVQLSYNQNLVYDGLAVRPK